MPKRISAADPVQPRVVIVTMDSHFGTAVSLARSALRRDVPGLQLSLHTADEFASDETALAECLADIASADIIIAGILVYAVLGIAVDALLRLIERKVLVWRSAHV